jgi:hypothetical protein
MFGGFLFAPRVPVVPGKEIQMNDELENCLSELRSVCEHLEPPPSRWQKIKARVTDWCLRNDVGARLIGFAVWTGLIVGVPLLLSMCDSNKSQEPKSRHGDTVAQYTFTYYADGAQEWEEVTNDQ